MSIRSASVLLFAAWLGAAAHAGADPGDASAPLPLLEPLSDGVTVDLPELDPQVPRPSDFLGYSLGSRFTHHSRVLAYLERLADASPRVRTWQYGTSYEGRPLTLVAISTPENIGRLEEIRRQHLRLADPRSLSATERERLARDTPVIIWLAYGVHGNESSSTEVAMAAAYLLAASEGEWSKLLSRAVVLIDPLVNPDGRERFVASYEQRRGRVANPDRFAAERSEPWPGGRQNHYLIDLNRDWAFATQAETRDRIAAVRAWEPQVYVDYHEMSVESSYFFPPPAEPVHKGIDRRVVGWLDTFGRANAAAFDRKGWAFFKNETYDLFYPGYGDSYPAFRGAVGMTYEVGGSGRAGAVATTLAGNRVSLADRIARHLTTSLATARTGAANATRLLQDFAAARAEAAGQEGPVYLWDARAPEAAAMADVLALHGVTVEQLVSETRLPVEGRAPARGEPDAPEPVERVFPAGTFVVSAAQPLGDLVRALFERNPELDASFLKRQRERLERNEATEFYDVTAWSMPLAFHVESWTLAPEAPRDLGKKTAPRAARAKGVVSGAAARVGFLIRPAGLAGYRLAAGLLSAGVRFRVALAGFELEQGAFPAGTFFVPRSSNPEDLQALIDRLATEAGVAAVGIDSSYTSRGPSLGSGMMPFVTLPRVGLVGGEGVSPTSFGFAWHLLDQQVQLPVTRLEINNLSQLEAADLDVLVLPDGNYGRAFAGETGEALTRWVRSGGVLVALEGAHGVLRDKGLSEIKTWEPPKSDDGNKDPEVGEASSFLDRQPIETPGAVFATRATPGHALLVGLPSPPAALVGGNTVLLPTGDPQKDALTAAVDAPVLAGVVWSEAEARLAGSLLVGMEPAGRGLVVTFAHEPNFRLFWRGTEAIFLNAVMLGPSLAR